MATSTVTTPVRLNSRQLATRGLQAVVLATIGVVVARVIAGVLLTVPAAFPPMTYAPIVGSAIVAGIGGTVVYGLLDRYTDRVRRNFLVAVALVFLGFMVPLTAIAPAMPGATTTLLAVLFVLHVVAAIGVTVPLLREPVA